MNTIMINDRFKDIESRIEKLERQQCTCHGKTEQSCPRHGKMELNILQTSETENWMKKHQEMKELYDWLNGESTKRPAMADKIIDKAGLWAGARHPYVERDALPLNVRVARALGLEPYEMNGKWYVYHKDGLSFGTPVRGPKPISPYDTDVALAIGALEEYCQKRGYAFMVENFGGQTRQYGAKILHGGTTGSISELLSQAICEAIVKHSEGE